MNLFQIDAELEKAFLSCVDPETGEIIGDMEALNKLEMARDTKIENTICLLKNIRADMKELKIEADAFAKRYKAAENRYNGLFNYLDKYLNGQEFKGIKGAVSYRKSQKVEITDLTAIPIEYVDYGKPKPDKKAIKAALKSGEPVDGAVLVNNLSMQIK